jgi:hypothetical protein
MRVMLAVSMLINETIMLYDFDREVVATKCQKFIKGKVSSGSQLSVSILLKKFAAAVTYL